MNSNDGNDKDNGNEEGLRIELEDNDQVYTVPVEINSNAEQVAFEFCKAHNVNYSHLPALTKRIAAYIYNRRRKANKRLFSIEEFMKRLKEKNEANAKPMTSTPKTNKAKTVSNSIRLDTDITTHTTHNATNTMLMSNTKPLKTYTIIDTNRHLDKFLYENRRTVIDSLYNQYNVILPNKDKSCNNSNRIIQSSELFLNFEHSNRKPPMQKPIKAKYAHKPPLNTNKPIGYRHKYIK